MRMKREAPAGVSPSPALRLLPGSPLAGALVQGDAVGVVEGGADLLGGAIPAEHVPLDEDQVALAEAAHINARGQGDGAAEAVLGVARGVAHYPDAAVGA